MISRYHLRCPGCGDVFIARLGVEPTSGTRFYLPCPHCEIPIQGRMSGQELENHQVRFECDMVDPDTIAPAAPVVTVNPFVPSRYDADTFSGTGAFPTLTLASLLGEQGFLDFGEDRGQAQAAVEQLWPATRMLFQYYLHDNATMFEKTAREKFEVAHVPKTAHQRTTVAYQALSITTGSVVGRHAERNAGIVQAFKPKHTAALNHRRYFDAIRARGMLAAPVERDLFTAISGFIDHREAWEMGALQRFATPSARAELEQLVLFRDEFSIVRDLYQQGFEVACKCLWVLIAAHNAVEHGDANQFGGPHPAGLAVKRRPRSLAGFDALPNAFKIAYVAQVPGWEPVAELLNNRRRNTIGHATARHDLRTGRVVSDKDTAGVTYLRFLAETLDVFEAVTTLAQILRAARVAASPDFKL